MRKTPYRPPRHGVFGVVDSTPLHLARGVSEFSRYWFNGEVLTLKTLRGEITVTENQPLRVPEGWLRAGHLVASHDLIFESPSSRAFNSIDKVWAIGTAHGTPEPLPHDDLDLEYLPLRQRVNFGIVSADTRVNALPIVDLVRRHYTGFVYSATTIDGWIIAGGLQIAAAESLASYAEHHGKFH